MTNRFAEIPSLSTQALLAAYGDILDELNDRRVVRTRNAPAGDLAETLTMLAYRGDLAVSSKKSWDVEAGGQKIQVKALVIPEGQRGVNFSVFRSTDDFSLAVFVIFDADYSVRSAIEVPARYVTENARDVPWVNGRRISAGARLLDAPGAVDRTRDFRAALRRIDSATASNPVY